MKISISSGLTVKELLNFYRSLKANALGKRRNLRQLSKYNQIENPMVTVAIWP